VSEIIQLENISKIIKNQMILKNISFEVESGDYISIVGPSGIGKSTLLSIIGLLETFSDGEYYYKNENVRDMSDKQKAHLRNKEFGIITQDYALINNYSLLSNIMIPITYSKEKNTNKDINSMIREFGLHGKEKQKAYTLSGGERQRTAIIRALINDPQVLLADEPTSSLDVKNSQYICNILSELNESGKTIIMVTHDEDIAKIAKKRFVFDFDGNLNEIKKTSRTFVK